MAIWTSETPTPKAVPVLLGALAHITWELLRLPLAAFLAILEPVIRIVLGGLALLLVLTALFWAFVRPLGSIPFFGMLGLAVALKLAAVCFSAALRRLGA